jgi:hypothetical protein
MKDTDPTKQRAKTLTKRAKDIAGDHAGNRAPVDGQRRTTEKPVQPVKPAPEHDR